MMATSKSPTAMGSVNLCGTSVAPEGWYCKRPLGHDGPCAGVPLERDMMKPADFELPKWFGWFFLLVLLTILGMVILFTP